MLKRLVFVGVCLGWLVVAVSAPAQAAQRAGDPPPMLTGTDQLQLAGALSVVVIGLALVGWSLRPGRRRADPSLLTRPAPARAMTSSRRVAAWTPAVDAGNRGSARSDDGRAVAVRAHP